MYAQISKDSYCAVFVVTIESNVDEDEPGYVNVDQDTYLKTEVEKFLNFLKDNYWEGRRCQGYTVICHELSGPDSSGYSNYATFHIGVYPAWKDDVDSLFKFFSDYISESKVLH